MLEDKLLFRPYFTPKQWQADETLAQTNVKEVLYGGAKGKYCPLRSYSGLVKWSFCGLGVGLEWHSRISTVFQIWTIYVFL